MTMQDRYLQFLPFWTGLMRWEQILRSVFQHTEGESQRAEIHVWQILHLHSDLVQDLRDKVQLRDACRRDHGPDRGRQREFPRSSSATHIKANNLRHEEHSSNTTSKKTIPSTYHSSSTAEQGLRQQTQQSKQQWTRREREKSQNKERRRPGSAVNRIVEQNQKTTWQNSVPLCLR